MVSGWCGPGGREPLRGALILRGWRQVWIGAFYAFDFVVLDAPVSLTFFASQCVQLRTVLADGLKAGDARAITGAVGCAHGLRRWQLGVVGEFGCVVSCVVWVVVWWWCCELCCWVRVLTGTGVRCDGGTGTVELQLITIGNDKFAVVLWLWDRVRWCAGSGWGGDPAPKGSGVLWVSL